MVSPDGLTDGLKAAMAEGVSELSDALGKEAGPEDNTVEFPFAEVIFVSNNKDNSFNTDKVGPAHDNHGNVVGEILEARFDLEVQLNAWLAVPSEDHDIMAIGRVLERWMRKYDHNRTNPDPLPDGSGGTLSDVGYFELIGGGELPTAFNNNPPLRGYQITANIRFKDTINTADEYGKLDFVEFLDIPTSGDLSDGGDNDEIDIEYNA